MADCHSKLGFTTEILSSITGLSHGKLLYISFGVPFIFGFNESVTILLTLGIQIDDLTTTPSRLDELQVDIITSPILDPILLPKAVKIAILKPTTDRTNNLVP